MKTNPPLQLVLQPSRLAPRAVLLLHLLALPMPWLAAMAWPWQLLATLMVLLSGVAWYRRGRQQQLVGMRLLADGSWSLRCNGAEVEATLLPGAHAHAFLLVLPFRQADGRTLRVLLWPDSSDAHALRRLRAWLRWGA
ncbi:hypothetical protein QWZ03_05265 [Chitinimonas viridis]|uniref:Toxin CptA n=1 Tax=Chitinimonas viridis TaxID=664880 RepID=A0ABT8B1Q9_9NEIS|nr:protein YgfX [Chitinimonas viridis]MDN3576174.1 hypothetical protein [Chitinimonas viridis]